MEIFIDKNDEVLDVTPKCGYSYDFTVANWILEADYNKLPEKITT